MVHSPVGEGCVVLAYNITNWVEAPGRREARSVGLRRMRLRSRAHALAHIRRTITALDEKETPRTSRAIGEVLRALGQELLDALVSEAKEIFAGPGMLVRNGSRQRSLGGIFFQLVRVALSTR
jgi:hypothetical protein